MKNSLKGIFSLFPNHKEIIEAYIGICLNECPNENDIASLIGVIFGNGYETTAEFLLAMGTLPSNPDQKSIKIWMEDSCDCDGEETISELLIKVVQLLTTMKENKNETSSTITSGPEGGPGSGPGDPGGPRLGLRGPESPGLGLGGPESLGIGPGGPGLGPVEADKIQDTASQIMDDDKSENEIIEKNINNDGKSPITSCNNEEENQENENKNQEENLLKNLNLDPQNCKIGVVNEVTDQWYKLLLLGDDSGDTNEEIVKLMTKPIGKKKLNIIIIIKNFNLKL